jgi:hypothetical protein
LTEEIDEELAKVEEALFSYGQREKIETIFGSDHQVKLDVERKVKYPLKGDPRRRALDELVRKAGKWMEVSDLNPWMLARVLDRNSWPPDLVKRVKEFASMEESRSVKVLELKERE